MADRTADNLGHARLLPQPLRHSATPSVFTAFLRRQQGEETPDAGLLHDAWNGLQAMLGGELKRRGLWHLSPCYLGVHGHERWDAEAAIGDPMSQAWGRTRAPQSALAELVADCWAYIFLDRMQSLKRQLDGKESIDGLILRNVRNFLHERQREHDPIGFRVFVRLKGALAGAVSHRTLFILGGDPRIRNNTVFGFEPATELRLPARDLGPVVVRWNDELLPDLVTASGRQEAAIYERLEHLLLGLPGSGFPCFRFKDLVDPLKNDARQRWALFLARDHAPGTIACTPDQARAARQVLPECAIESRQSFEHLTCAVSSEIATIELDPRTRRHLGALWSYLLRRSQKGRLEGASGSETTTAETTGAPLSHRRLSQRLQIPRERIPTLLAHLQELLLRYRASSKGRLPRDPASVDRGRQQAGPASIGCAELNRW